MPDVTSLVFSADGGILVAGTDDGRIQLWDVTTTHQLLHTLNGHRTAVTKVEFNIDNSILISKSDDAVKFWGIQN
jgi:WD40 repeat protein